MRQKSKFLRACFDFEYFCKEYLGLILADFHKKIAKAFMEHDRVLVVCPRQHGKTEIAIAYALWYVVKNKNKNIAIVSSSERQSKKVLERIKTYIDGVEELRFLNPSRIEIDYFESWQKTWNKLEIYTSTKCRIYCSPFNSSIRGSSLDIVICDDILRDDVLKNMSEEAAIQLFREAVTPTVSARHGKIFVIGTPQTYTDLLSDLEKPTRGYHVIKFKAVIFDEKGNWKKPLWDSVFTLERLKRIRDEIGGLSFSKEYLINPVTSDISLFSPNIVEQCVSDDIRRFNALPNCQYFMGVDVAMSKDPKADFTVFTVIEENEVGIMKVVHIERHQGLGPKEHIEKAKELNRVFKFACILWEDRGLSKGIVIEAKKDDEIGLISEGFITSRQRKEEILSKLEAAFSRRILFIPDDDQLRRELYSFRTVKRNGRIVLEGVGEHDDMVMSLAIALEAVYNFSSQITVSFV